MRIEIEKFNSNRWEIFLQKSHVSLLYHPLSFSSVYLFDSLIFILWNLIKPFNLPFYLTHMLSSLFFHLGSNLLRPLLVLSSHCIFSLWLDSQSSFFPVLLSNQTIYPVDCYQHLPFPPLSSYSIKMQD